MRNSSWQTAQWRRALCPLGLPRSKPSTEWATAAVPETSRNNATLVDGGTANQQVRPQKETVLLAERATKGLGMPSVVCGDSNSRGLNCAELTGAA